MARELTIAGERFPLHTPFRISRGVKTAAEVVSVTIGEGALTGRGECVPYPHYGETPASTIAEIEEFRPLIEQGAGRDEIARLMPAGAARNAVDCALWDLELRQADISFAARFHIGPVATAVTISLDTPEAMGTAALALAGVPLIKVKVDAGDPEALLRAVRAAAPHPRLIVDPNESWNIAHIRELQGALIELNVDLLEQPLPADEDDVLAGITSAIPIAADESLHTTSDLERVATRYQVVNIKLDKTGGLTEALELAAKAKALGMGLMTGCMVCSSLGIVPALATAMDSSFVDLDGPLWLAQDRPGGVTIRDGMILPPSPGFWGA